MGTVDDVQNGADLTARAEAVIGRAGQPSGDGVFRAGTERAIVEGTDW